MKTIHELKSWPAYFAGVSDGSKTFEIRKNDRNFAVGDILIIREWYPQAERYSGEVVVAIVTYVTDFQQPEGQVVMGIKTWNPDAKTT